MNKKIATTLNIVILVCSILMLSLKKTSSNVVHIESDELMREVYDSLANQTIVYVQDNASNTIAVVANGTKLTDGYYLEINSCVDEGIPLILVENTSQAPTKIYDFSKSIMRFETNATTYIAALKAYPIYVHSSRVEEILFHTGDTDALTDVIQWSNNVYNATKPTSFIGEMTTSSLPEEEFSFAARHFLYRVFKPRCKINIINEWYVAPGDANPGYDYFAGKLITQSVPGFKLSQEEEGWEHWRTADIYNDMDVSNHGWYPSRLSNYGPTTSSGVESVSYTVGVGVPMPPPQEHTTPTVNFRITNSYAVSDVEIEDLSDFEKQVASWRHDVNENRDVGHYSYKVEPGLSCEITTADCSSVLHSYSGTYAMHGIPFEIYWNSPKTLCWTFFDYSHPVTIKPGKHAKGMKIIGNGGGTTTPGAGYYMFSAGDEIMIASHPDEGYILYWWDVNGQAYSGCPTLRLTVDRSKEITPIFYRLPYRSIGTGGGAGGGC